MTTVTYSNARQNLKTLLDKAWDDSEVIRIKQKSGKNVVLISEIDYESLDETAYLSANPANKAHLDEAIKRLENGEGVEMNIEDL